MRHIYILLLWLVAATMSAQRLQGGLTHNFQGASLSEALIWIDNAQDSYKLNFIFDELEDFTVTTQLKDATAEDAVRQVCGFYPIHLTFDERDIYIECTQKAGTKLSGRITDGSDLPIAYTSISLLSLSDSVLITGGVSNEAGDFVIPCAASKVIARFSCIGYKTIEKVVEVGYIGTLSMSPDKYALRGIIVKGSMPQYQMGSEGLITNEHPAESDRDTQRPIETRSWPHRQG